LLGALAAWTDRVRLVTTVMVPQLHDPVMLAKAGVALEVTSGRIVKNQWLGLGLVVQLMIVGALVVIAMWSR